MHKGGWTGPTNCEFCGAQESIDHLLFECATAKVCWSIMCCSFGINNGPSSVEDLLSIWILQFRGRQRRLIAVGVSALCWTIWKSRNASCFSGIVLKAPTNLLFSVCYWMNFWADLQKGGGSG